MAAALKNHWPEYLIEGVCLGLFMTSAFAFGSLLEHPSSPVRQAITNPLLRRALMGVAMGSTAVTLIYSRWGKRSGAHINPATTLTFWRLGKVKAGDALFYIVSQFFGGLFGASVAALLLSNWITHPAVNFVVTAPGRFGVAAAFAAEVGITFVLMTVILHVSNDSRLHKFTGACAGLLVALYITFEAPISGMSMNPARTMASAIPARHWDYLWVYFSAPLIGMLGAAELYLRSRGAQRVGCAKLHHQNSQRCIFCGQPAEPISPARPEKAEILRSLSRESATRP